MVIYCQNLVNMLHNSVIMQSLLRIRKKYKFSSSWGILHISANLQGVFAKRHVAKRLWWDVTMKKMLMCYTKLTKYIFSKHFKMM